MDPIPTDPPEVLDNPLFSSAESAPIKELTPRMKAFVHEYVHDLNATRAYIRAGYSPNAANVGASQLLATPNIADAVKQALEVRASRVNMSADSVLEEVATLAHACVDHYRVDDDGNLCLAEGAPPNAMRAIASVKRRKIVKEDAQGNVTITYEVEFKLWDKPGALKLMGRHVGIKAFADRLELTGAGGGPIEIAAARLAAMPADELQQKVTQLAIDAVAEEVA